ncbi:MAG: hypothetical protein FWB88_05360 [Defluviitaleaceae bacterium]|nr:hypothetical protein [Defluviitaleaceae bacterium]MCL2239782.1 hypothetical protein [Defluviitaleaceae bacterium]
MGMEQERQKVQKLLELGEYAHMLVRNGQMNDEKMKSLSAEITELDKTLHASLGRKPPTRDDGVCPGCGIAFSGIFCSGCGINVDEFFAKPIPSCAVCGMQVNEEDIFCGVCGSKKGA